MHLTARSFSKIVIPLFGAIFFLESGKALGQDTTVLTPRQMYADFDTLTAKLHAISPHLRVKKDLWHYDAFKQISRLRKSIDTIRSRSSFELLIGKALNSCQDYHTGMLDLPAVLQDAGNHFHLYLPLVYLDGNYVVAKTFRTATDTIPAGAVVIRINHVQADDFVAGLTGDLVMRYDLDRKKFYAEDFWRNQQTMLDGKIDLTFKEPGSRLADVPFDCGKRLDFIHPIRDTNRNQVTYWPDRRILYIRIYVMDSKLIPGFQKKIAAFRNRHPAPEKIIIDLRGNGGGNDEVWQSVYQAILPQSFSYQLILDGPDPHKLPSTYLKDMEINLDSTRQESSLLLKKYGFYQYVNKRACLAPTDTSLHFAGKVVVLGDENNYSAGASAFVVPDQRTANWYSIGRPTGRFLGVGYSPVVLQLPFSGIRYRIEPALEVTGAKQLRDLMHDHFGYTVPYTLEDIINRDKFDGNPQGTYYLEHFDPVINKALGL